MGGVAAPVTALLVSQNAGADGSRAWRRKRVMGDLIDLSSHLSEPPAHVPGINP
jgi:hypothetical protein